MYNIPYRGAENLMTDVRTTNLPRGEKEQEAVFAHVFQKVLVYKSLKEQSYLFHFS